MWHKIFLYSKKFLMMGKRHTFAFFSKHYNRIIINSNFSLEINFSFGCLIANYMMILMIAYALFSYSFKYIQ